MKKYTFFLLPLALVCTVLQSQAQWFNNDTVYNAGSLVTDINGQGHNAATGRYTTAGSAGAPSSYGVFNHMGQSGTGTAAAFINDGMYNAAVNGQDYFKGPGGTAGQQEIAGSAMPVFGQLYLQNGAASTFTITNTNGIRVATSLMLQNGTTTTVRANTSNGSIRMDDDATYTATNLGDAQHINGYVTKSGNDIFTFPVGSGTDLRTLTMSAPGITTDAYTVAWIAGNPATVADPSDATPLHPVNAVTTPITSVSTTGQWDWIVVSGTGAGLAISVSIPDLSSTGAAASDLRLVGWDGSSWVNLSGGSTATGVIEGSTLSGIMQTGITAVGIGTINVLTPLPVTYTSFTAETKNCSVELNWTTGMEKDNAHFDIQRNAGGMAWKNIGQVTASATRRYSFTDKMPVGEKLLYRLRQADVDGTSSYSDITTVQLHCQILVKVYPNPTHDLIQVSGTPEHSTVQLINALGQVISEQKTNVSDTRITMAGLAYGLYWVRILQDNTVINMSRIAYTR